MSVDARPLVAPAVGHDWLACTEAVLDVGLAASWVVLPSCGASVTFVGTTRDHAVDGDQERRGVHLLEYEAYDEQVGPALARVAAGARARASAAGAELGRLVIWHRTGALCVTDVAVVVSVSTPHRAEAFDIARWVIDEVKATAPIWKREHWDAGVAWGVPS